jgi:ferric-dicitrate binding protein FerR (iron transport regulator)
MTIHPMAEQPRAAANQQSRAAARKHRRLSDRAVGLCALVAIAGLAAIAFASGQYPGTKPNGPLQTAGQAVPAPAIVPIEEPANPN